MSDSSIIIVPEEPGFLPAAEARERAVKLFHRIAPRAEQVKQVATDSIRFIDCGPNLERIQCPHCSNEIALDWWHEKMEEEAHAGFPLKRLPLPCCLAETSLHEMRYDRPQAFARFTLEAMNPAIPALTEDQILWFQAVLGCRLRVVQHRI